jgi:hypothetical protein
MDLRWWFALLKKAEKTSFISSIMILSKQSELLHEKAVPSTLTTL